MGFARSLAAEFEQEMKTTREVLSRVPADKADWKPHPKSYSISDLAIHITNIASIWMPITLQEDELDLSPGRFPKRTFTTTEELVAEFDKNVETSRKAVSEAKDEQMGSKWTLRSGDHVVFSMPRAVVLRSFVMNHLIHHRGQLTVYLRLLDVPLPSVYGPTADESRVCLCVGAADPAAQILVHGRFRRRVGGGHTETRRASSVWNLRLSVAPPTRRRRGAPAPSRRRRGRRRHTESNR